MGPNVRRGKLLVAIYLNSDKNHKGPDCKVGELMHDDL
jgi:hypothetical protein